MALVQTCPHCEMVNHNFEECIACKGKSEIEIDECTACDGFGIVRTVTCSWCGEYMDED